MAAEDGQPEPITGDPATNGVTGRADLIEQAQRLGQQHRAAGMAPFGDAGYVFWDAGSARLLGALGVPSIVLPREAPSPGGR